MADTSPKMSIDVIEGVTVATLADQRILDEISISQIGTKLSEIIAQTPKPKLVIDFANVTNMSSSALGMLITLHKRVKDAYGVLRLCNIQPTIAEVFKITRLDEIFQICQSRGEAITSING